MATLEEFKEHLHPDLLKLSDEKIERIRYTLERFATIAFDQWLAERNKKKTKEYEGGSKMTLQTQKPTIKQTTPAE